MYLRQLGFIDLDPGLDVYFNGISKFFLFASGITGSLLILINVFRAYRQRRRLHRSIRVVKPSAASLATDAGQRKERAMSMNILILDDERIVGERLRASLEKNGHTLETFTDPVLAMDRIRETVFDVVILDIRMDGMSGIQVLEAVKKKSDRTRVIMITGYATLEVARESLTKGAFDFIAKPFKLREMHQAIQKAEESLASETA